jgi:hypothetical protein
MPFRVDSWIVLFIVAKATIHEFTRNRTKTASADARKDKSYEE